MPKPNSSPKYPPCLAAIRHHLSLGRLDLAVSTLPLLAHAGLRPPFPLLASLLRRCLLSSSTLHLACRIHLFLRLTGLLSSVPSSTRLANHLLSLHFLMARPSDACRLFDRMVRPNIFSFNAMLIGYARLGLLDLARRLFDQMPHRDLVSWNTMLGALARGGLCRDAVSLYSQLRCSSLGFNPYTFSSLLLACVRLVDPKLAQQVHTQVLLVGFLPNVVISSSLVDAYAKCGCIHHARKLFDEMPVKDVLAWTTMIHGYAKCGDLATARRLFNEMPDRNPVTWTALVRGYTRNGQPCEALNLFRNMVHRGVSTDQFTFSSTLCACAAIASLKHGKQIHGWLLRTHFNPNATVLSSLIDMYSKCGDLAGARRVFARIAHGKRDTVVWNTMISAEGRHGNGIGAINVFDEMIRMEQKLDSNTFVVLLTACSHSGLVEKGLRFFELMAEGYNIVPNEAHYVCLVDLLGRAGHFEEAKEWLGKMSCRSDVQAWKALLGACRTHGKMQLAREVAEHIIKSEPADSAAYVLLSNIHSQNGTWDFVEKVRRFMEESQVKKERASSWI